ncbi:mannonate dehydratase [Halarchaeum acidiphilum]|nr:mannonate dehydratase [Halarchaeum acidiphilum]
MSTQQMQQTRQDSELFNGHPMRSALGTYKPLTDDRIRLMRQLGVSDVLLTPHRHEGFESSMPMGEAWSETDLTALVDRVNDLGMRLFAFEKMPVPLYEILLAAGDERAEKIDVIAETVRNMGAAGVPVLGYSGHPPDGAVRTTREYPVRGDALASAYDEDDLEPRRIVDHDVTESELWEAYQEFLDAVLPVAEEVGVTLAVHPSDPPVEELFGVPLLFRNRENFERALEMGNSPNHGLKLCLGCWSEMGEDVEEIIRSFGGDDIVYVHFRDVVGTVPQFHETFLDDPEGNYDEYAVVRALDDVGFDGVMTPDHVPLLQGDEGWEFGSILGRTYTVGYLNGLLRSVRTRN